MYFFSNHIKILIKYIGLKLYSNQVKVAPKAPEYYL